MKNKLFFLFFLSINLFASQNLAQKLIKAYPNFLKEYSNNQIIWQDDTKMIFDDKKEYKNYEDRLNNGSLKEQLSPKYIKINENPNYIPKENEDSGRVRYEDFFKKMYGKNQKEIEKNLVKIKWLPNLQNKTLWISKINGIDKKLEIISSELEKLPKEFHKYIVNPDGVYNFRKISNTNRLSSHSFGISIDLNKKYSNYWLWEKNGKSFVYKNQIPLEIVKIFERYGFIWGGRWYHYDTMHFEYRPELLLD